MLELEETSSSAMPVQVYHTTSNYILEDSNLHSCLWLVLSQEGHGTKLKYQNR